jgi:proline iminopeptidase
VLNRVLLVMPLLAACAAPAETGPANGSPLTAYFDNTGRDDVLSGGVKLIPITTPKGTFKVWTKRVGNNPTI